MRINFTYIIPQIQAIFFTKKKMESNNKFHLKNTFKAKEEVCFSDVLVQKFQKIKK